jgi:hypothetical protein
VPSISDTYRVEAGALIRIVVPRRGKPYEHACTEEVYKDVAYAIEQLGSQLFKVEDIRRSLDAPFTQANVAVMFLLERGCIRRTRGRMLVATTTFVYEDALIEYHALREGSPGSASLGAHTGATGAAVS